MGHPFLPDVWGEHLQAREGSPLGEMCIFQTQGTLEARRAWGPVFFHSDCVPYGQAFTPPCFPSCGHFQNGSLTLSLGHALSPGHREHFLVDSQRKVWKKA